MLHVKSCRESILSQIDKENKSNFQLKGIIYGYDLNYWIQKEKIAPNNLLVITDDIALPFGKIRIKPKGSDGGHNGLKDIQLVLNSNKYSRLRFGVGSEFNPGNQVNYVLGEWSKEEEKALEERAETIGNAIKSFVTIGLDRTMNEFNNK